MSVIKYHLLIIVTILVVSGCSNAADILILNCEGTTTNQIFSASGVSETIENNVKTYQIKNKKWESIECSEYTKDTIFCGENPRELNYENDAYIRINRIAGTITEHKRVSLVIDSRKLLNVTFYEGKCEKSTKNKF